MISIHIAKDFSRNPGPRFRNEGPHSGQEFREEILQPRFDEARSRGEQLQIVLDGVEFGYPTSFLEEAFGGLARIRDVDAVLKGLSFTATEEPLLEREIRGYIAHANELKAPQQPA
jgi:hypothetical protein